MKIFIVSIGNELLDGSIFDTNANFLAKELSKNGYKVSEIILVGDDKRKLVDLFEQLMEQKTLIITTGGLGPTFDDRTVEAISKACGKRLKLNKSIYLDILTKVRSKGIKPKQSHINQAYIPVDAKIIPNLYGTAPGIFLKCKNSYIVCMPGVPSEMKPMFENFVLSKIKEIVKPFEIYRYDLKLIGVAESDVDKFLKEIDTKGAEIVLNAMEGELAVRIISRDIEIARKIKEYTIENFGLKVFSTKDEQIEDVLASELDKLDMKISFIESITAGYLSFMMYGKNCFYKSLITKNTLDTYKKAEFGDSDIIAQPCNLSGNEFDLYLKVNDELIKTTLRYLGNINFMRKSVSKRTLGFVYQILKEKFD